MPGAKAMWRHNLVALAKNQKCKKTLATFLLLEVQQKVDTAEERHQNYKICQIHRYTDTIGFHHKHHFIITLTTALAHNLQFYTRPVE